MDFNFFIFNLGNSSLRKDSSMKVSWRQCLKDEWTTSYIEGALYLHTININILESYPIFKSIKFSSLTHGDVYEKNSRNTELHGHHWYFLVFLHSGMHAIQISTFPFLSLPKCTLRLSFYMWVNGILCFFQSFFIYTVSPCYNCNFGTWPIFTL